MSIMSYITGLFRSGRRWNIDGATDQYNRVFMVRLLLVCSLIMVIAWHRSSMRCYDSSEDFTTDMCWLKGLYLYKELLNESSITPYYGMSKDMTYNGMVNGTTELCRTGRWRKRKSCIPMTRIYFSQYHFMPFVMLFIAIIYYLPYLAFRRCNKEKYALQEAIKKDSQCAENVVNQFFPKFQQGQQQNSDILLTESHRMTIRIIMNILTKILYIIVNVVIFVRINAVLKGRYVDYGTKALKWFNLEETIQARHAFPGDFILPSVGYCEYEGLGLLSTRYVKVLCELSQNRIYQYCLLLLWFTIIFGIAISILGLIQLLCYYFCLLLWSSRDSYEIRQLSLRQMELLDYIRQEDLPFYEECRKLLRKEENVESPTYALMGESKGV